VKQDDLVNALFAEIDKSLDRGKVEVEEDKAREGADWLAKIEEENAGELTPERIAQMEAEAADTDEADITAPATDGNGDEPYLKPVKGGKRVELDEEASPTAGRRFSRT
jgi:(E)-4-hydroxy-3-methylbut-2-enyl-diphosphate synthase